MINLPYQAGLDLPEMPVGEGMTGTGFEVLLKLPCFAIIGETDGNYNFPRT